MNPISCAISAQIYAIFGLENGRPSVFEMIRSQITAPGLLILLVLTGTAIAVFGMQTKMIALLVGLGAVLFLWKKPEYFINLRDIGANL